MQVGGERAGPLPGRACAAAAAAAAETCRGGAALAGAGLDLGDQAHLVHGVDAEAAVDLELAQQRQPQQRAHRIVRQRRRAAQRQLERLRLGTCAAPAAPPPPRVRDGPNTAIPGALPTDSPTTGSHQFAGEIMPSSQCEHIGKGITPSALRASGEQTSQMPVHARLMENIWCTGKGEAEGRRMRACLGAR